MPGPAPVPDGERRRRNTPTFNWTLLPAEGRKGAIPKLPEVRAWLPQTREWWRWLWRLPQATMFDSKDEGLRRMALLRDIVWTQGADDQVAGSVLAELRQLEDRYGLNPKAMLQLRWRVDEAPEAESRARHPAGKAQSRRSRALEVITGGNA